VWLFSKVWWVWKRTQTVSSWKSIIVRLSPSTICSPAEFNKNEIRPKNVPIEVILI